MTRAELYRLVKTNQAFAREKQARELAEENRRNLGSNIFAFNLPKETIKPRLQLVKSCVVDGGSHA